jgi:hypothetical protein
MTTTTVAIRPVEELIVTPDPVWGQMQEMVSRSVVPVTVIPADPTSSESALFRLQISVGTALGALVFETGGLLVDHGWLRILGGGGSIDGHTLPDVATVNGLGDPSEGEQAPAAFTVAYDVLGGRFAVNNGGLPGEGGKVCYWGPDTLEWTPLGITHTGFVEWALCGMLAQFYNDLRWPGWEAEVAAVPADQGLACYPFLFSAEGRDIADALRCPAPFDELLVLHDDLARQVGYLPSAPTIRQPRHTLRAV